MIIRTCVMMKRTSFEYSQSFRAQWKQETAVLSSDYNHCKQRDVNSHTTEIFEDPVYRTNNIGAKHDENNETEPSGRFISQNNRQARFKDTNKEQTYHQFPTYSRNALERSQTCTSLLSGTYNLKLYDSQIDPHWKKLPCRINSYQVSYQRWTLFTLLLCSFFAFSAAQDVDLGNLPVERGIRIIGAAAGYKSGWAISNIGDVNGDSVDDVISGAYLASASAGITYVIFGRSRLAQLTTPLVDIQLPTTVMPASVGFRILGAAANDFSGARVGGAGDVNGDGIGDIIIGSYQADPPSRSLAGISYIIFGRNIPGGAAPFGDIQLTTGATAMASGVGFRVLGAAASDESGCFVRAAGDVNHDGIDDIIIGARSADPPSRLNAGITYVIFGRNYLTGATPFTYNCFELGIRI